MEAYRAGGVGALAEVLRDRCDGAANRHRRADLEKNLSTFTKYQVWLDVVYDVSAGRPAGCLSGPGCLNEKKHEDKIINRDTLEQKTCRTCRLVLNKQRLQHESTHENNDRTNFYTNKNSFGLPMSGLLG